jgi:hypothetical protein
LGCYNHDESDLYPVWEAMYREALELAGSLQDYEIVNAMLSELEENVYGIDDSESAARQRYRSQKLASILPAMPGCTAVNRTPKGARLDLVDETSRDVPIDGNARSGRDTTSGSDNECRQQAVITNLQRDELKRLFTPDMHLQSK